uniref:Arf-GAP with Rho-GAP domain, ANK repeat and PH domain-containing protein 2 n=1 Tax=Cacopsylla melanoneura TaxID=428564 RepID=A0A8D9B6Q9_9HEMI
MSDEDRFSSDSDTESPQKSGKGGNKEDKKRPIPLPRSKLNVDCDSSLRSDSSTTSSSKRSFRKRMKSASENINGVLEGTKQVRTKLKRVWSRPGSVHKSNSVFHDETDDSKSEPDRRQSLPVDDIFNKISFASPLDIGTQIKHWRGDFNIQSLDDTQGTCDSSETATRCDSETGSDVTSVADSSVFYYEGESVSLPPPSYPPPPLPSCEDMSDVSSQSGSYYTIGTIDTDRFCEEVLDSVSRLQNISLSEQDTRSIVSRSDSWSFQGSTSPGVQQSSTYETFVLPSFPLLPSPSPSHPLQSLSPSSSEIVSSTSSSSHPLSPSIQSSEYDNNKLVHSPTDHHSYENWNLSTPGDDQESSSQSSEFCSLNPRLVHSQSVIFEFDPLFHFVDQLPKPPERVDSFGTVQAGNTPHGKEAQDQDTRQESEDSLVESPSTGKKRLAWTSMKQAIRNLADTSVRRGSKTSEFLLSKDKDIPSLERPTFCIFNTCIYNGFLYKCCGERSKDVVCKYFQLTEGKLSWSNDKNGPSKELFTLESMLSIKRIPDRRQSSTGEDVYCFQVSTSSPKSKVFVLGASCTSERRIWMQKLIESCTQSFSTKITSDFTRASWCFLKEGVTNEWSYAWVILQERVLLYGIEGANSVQEVDLKKARSIVCSEADSSLPKVTESSNMILVDYPSSVLYLHMASGLETRAWAHDMKCAATNSGPLLVDQQLTRDEIPVLVEKCVNFVFAHGSMSEGIYRRSGSNNTLCSLSQAVCPRVYY